MSFYVIRRAGGQSAAPISVQGKSQFQAISRWFRKELAAGWGGEVEYVFIRRAIPNSKEQGYRLAKVPFGYPNAGSFAVTPVHNLLTAGL